MILHRLARAAIACAVILGVVAALSPALAVPPPRSEEEVKREMAGLGIVGAAFKEALLRSRAPIV